MVDMANGKRLAHALFSTNLGEFAPRAANEPLPPVILHSDIHEDKLRFASTLRQKYPTQCGAIAPTFNLEDYFDAYDIHLQTPVYLVLVLQEIVAQNIARAAIIHNFAVRWSRINREMFASISPDVGGPQEIFSAREQEQFGADFLKDALVALKVQKAHSSSVDPSNTTRKAHSAQDYMGESSMSGEFDSPSARYPIQSSSYGPMVQACRYSSAPNLSQRDGPTTLNWPSLERFQSFANGYIHSESEVEAGQGTSKSCGFTENSSYRKQDPYHTHVGKPYLEMGPVLRPVYFATNEHNRQAENPVQRGTVLLPGYSSPRDLPSLPQSAENRGRSHPHSRFGPTFAIARATSLSRPPGIVEQVPHSNMWHGGSGAAKDSMDEAGKRIYNVSVANVECGQKTVVHAGGNNSISSEPYPADLKDRSFNTYNAHSPSGSSAPPFEDSFHNMHYPQMHGVQLSQVRMVPSSRATKARLSQSYDCEGRVCDERVPSIGISADPNHENSKPAHLAINSCHSNNHTWHTRPSDISLTSVSNGARINKASPTRYRNDRPPFRRETASIHRRNDRSSQVHAVERSKDHNDQVLANPLQQRYQNETAIAAYNDANEGSCKLYVGNISVALTESKILDAFSRYGQVDHVTLKGYPYPDGPRTRPKYAFILFRTPQDAVKAFENMNGYVLCGRPLRVNFARPQAYLRDRRAPFIAGTPKYLSAEDPISVEQISIASPQRGANVTAKGSTTRRTIDETLPSRESALACSYHLPAKSQFIDNSIREPHHNASTPVMGEPSEIQVHHRPGAAPDLKHPYSHFYSNTKLDDNSLMLPQRIEDPRDDNKSISSSRQNSWLPVVPRDLLDHDGFTFRAVEARANNRPPEQPGYIVRGEPSNHVGWIDDTNAENILHMSEGHYDLNTRSVIGVEGAPDRLTSFSPQDARSDLPSQLSNPLINSTGLSRAEAFVVQQSKNITEADCSQMNTPAMYRDRSEIDQLTKSDQEPSPNVRNRASPDKRKGSRKISSKFSSPTKADTYPRAKSQSRDASVSRKTDPHTESSRSSKNLGRCGELPPTTFQLAATCKNNHLENPKGIPPINAVANSDATIVGKHEVVTTHAAMNSLGHAPPSYEVKDAIQIVPKLYSHSGNAQAQALRNQEQSLTRSITPSVAKVKRASKTKKKRHVITGTLPAISQVEQPVQDSASKDSPANIVQHCSPNDLFQGDPLVSGSATDLKHTSTTAMPESTLEADHTPCREGTARGSFSRGDSQGGLRDTGLTGRWPTIADSERGASPRGLSLGQLSDSIADKQADHSESYNKRTIEFSDGSATGSRPPLSLGQALDEPNISEKKASRFLEHLNHSTSNPKDKKIAMGQSLANQATPGLGIKRAVPILYSTLPSKRIVEEADATRTIGRSAPDLNSRFAFPDLGVVKPDRPLERTEDMTSAKLSQRLQAYKTIEPSVKIRLDGYDRGSHIQNKAPLEPPLGHCKSASRDVVELDDTQSSVEEVDARQVSGNGEGRVSKAEQAKPPTWSEVVGRSASSSQHQKHGVTEPEPTASTVHDPWAIDEDTVAWNGQFPKTENTTVKSTRSEILEVNSAPKSAEVKHDTAGSYFSHKENVKSLGKKAHDASSQKLGAKRRGTRKEQVDADAWAKSWNNGFVGSA
ncbi:MAG: Poly(U)-binding-splicing factor puf60 [Candelina submexicana]|nr:MAG: Poly(U)-binding-splicing factor puf60 [Candelina submexicana]